MDLTGLLHRLHQFSIFPPETGSAAPTEPPPTGSDQPTVQASLRVNAPGDAFEQEAERMAALVMRTPTSSDGEVEESITPASAGGIQRAASGSGLDVSPEVESNIDSMRGGGNPLPASERSFFEHRFGHDFSQIRIHADSRAAETAQSLDARAFTVGTDIAFDAGEYQPGTTSGRELLAHELTHTIQQTGGIATKRIQRKADDEERSPAELVAEAAQQLSDDEVAQQAVPPIEARPVALPDAVVEDSGGAASGEGAASAPAPAAQEQHTPDAAEQPTATSSPTPATPATASPAVPAQTATPAPTPAATEANHPTVQPAEASEAASAPSGSADTSTEQAAATPQQGASGSGQAGYTGAEDDDILVQRMPAGRMIQRAPRSPDADPAFQAVAASVTSTAAEQKQHAPAEQKASEAAAAAKMPPEEKLGAAQNTQASAIDAAAEAQEQATQGDQAPGFNKAAFKASLKARIDELTPKDPKQMENIEGSGVFTDVKAAVDQQVDSGKDQAQGTVDDKVKEAPNPSAVPDKPTTALQPNMPGQAPGQLDTAGAAPKPKGSDEVEQPLQAESKQLDSQMAAARITPAQLQNSNEPPFQGALQAKTSAQEHVQQTLPQYRAKEQAQIQDNQSEADTLAQTGLGAMFAQRTSTCGQIDTLQSSTKGEDEAKRAEIGRQIDGIFQRTKGDVEAILAELDSEVEQIFDSGAGTAKQLAIEYIKRETDAYKAKRYASDKSLLDVGAQWDGLMNRGRDTFMGMPPEYYRYYEQGRDLYILELDKVLDQVADIVGNYLARAHQRVQQGREEIQAYVESQPEELREVAQQAAQEAEDKFGDLEQTIDSKQNEIVDGLAQKYVENLQALDSELEAMKEAEKGLLAKAGDMLNGVIKTIGELKDLLLSTLQRAAGAVMTILENPVAFLGNLLSALGQGLRQFAGNIGTHLQQGLIEWLTGTLAAGGIQLPANWDLQGIFSLVMQILGLTYPQIRAQIVKGLGPIGETVIGALEGAWEVFQIIQSEGLAGLWQFIQDQIGDLKALVIDQIKEMIASQVIQAGIDWLIGILGGPAGAFIKAVQAIVRVVSWFVENAQRLSSLFHSIIDSVIAVAAGDIGGAAGLIEQSLAKALPSVISFLANLLGLGGISQKVQAILQKVRAPIERAIDWLVQKAVALGKKLWGMLKGKGTGNAAHTDVGTPDEDAKKRDALPEAERILGAEGATSASVERQLPGLQERHSLKQRPQLIPSGGESYYIQLMRKDDRTEEKKLIFAAKRDFNRDPDKAQPHDGRPDDAPIVEEFRLAYNRLDSWDKAIKKNSPEIYKDFMKAREFDIANRGEYVDTVKDLTKKYKKKFRDLTDNDTETIKNWYIENVMRITKNIEAKNISIAKWYKEKTGITDSDNDLIESIHNEGTDQWREEWKQAATEVDRILRSTWPDAKLNLQNWVSSKQKELPYMIGDIGELDYIGSLATGIKGPPKQGVRFNPESFDVDANLKAPPLAAYALRKNDAPVDRNRIFAQYAGISPLSSFTSKVDSQLKNVKGVKHDEDFDVAIEADEEDIENAKKADDNLGLIERLSAQQKADEATRRFYQLRNSLKPSVYAQLVTQIQQLSCLIDGHIQGTSDKEALLSQQQYDEILKILASYEASKEE
ncbi:MAG: hypothetical protein OHK0022_34620 [Roseiflexaceae bacterium]